MFPLVKKMPLTSNLCEDETFMFDHSNDSIWEVFYVKYSLWCTKWLKFTSLWVNLGHHLNKIYWEEIRFLAPLTLGKNTHMNTTVFQLSITSAKLFCDLQNIFILIEILLVSYCTFFALTSLKNELLSNKVTSYLCDEITVFCGAPTTYHPFFRLKETSVSYLRALL